MDSGAVIWMILAILGAALVAGGVVGYRKGTGPAVKAFSAAAIAAGVVMWLIVLVTLPAS